MEFSKRTKRNTIIILWLMFLTPIIFVGTMFILIANEKIGYIPPFEELENPKSDLASQVISCDNVLLGKYYKENRTNVQFDDLSSNVVNALLATEDVRFYEHSGIDFTAIGRVIKGLATGNSAGGGSTITQQLAKNLYNMRDHKRPKGIIGKFVMKFQEWVTAIRLERRYTKDEIMTMYLNTVTFGHNAYGIQSAAKTFFNKNPHELKIEEAAVLVGLLKAPTKYSPKSNPQNAIKRRNTVLSQIEKYQDKLNEITGYAKLSHQEYQALKQEEIHLDFHQQTHNDGMATYFREFLRGYLSANQPDRKKYATEQSYKDDSIQWANDPLYGWCNKNHKADGTPYNIYNDGLKIYVTLDSRMQKYAEEAVTEHMGLGYVDETGKKQEALQSMFERMELKNKKEPFSWRLKQEQKDQIMVQSIKRSDRYRVGKKAGLDSAKIWQQFKTPTKMTVFSWHGNIDTVMTPWDSILYYKRFLRAGFMSMDPISGQVKAYVGGINYEHFKYDHVSMGRRQVGSTFKPFIYTMALMHGLTPNHKVPNVNHIIDMPEGQQPPTYCPKFSPSKLDGQMITLKQGLANSLNQISAFAMKQTSPEHVIELVRKLGVNSPIDPVYSLCVGAAEIKVREMVAAYCGFVNKGTYTQPIFVSKICDKNGNVISSFQPKRTVAMDDITAYKMVDMLRGVVDYGTANRLRRWFKITADVGGKTGTTNLNADGWYMGITPKLVNGAWVGGEERNIQFTNGQIGQGAQLALPIWGLYMTKVYKDASLGYSQNDKFEAPANYSDIVKDDKSIEESIISNSQEDFQSFTQEDEEW